MAPVVATLIHVFSNRGTQFLNFSLQIRTFHDLPPPIIRRRNSRRRPECLQELCASASLRLCITSCTSNVFGRPWLDNVASQVWPIQRNWTPFQIVIRDGIARRIERLTVHVPQAVERWHIGRWLHAHLP